MPTISINAPANGFQANVFDTLHVNIHCADNVVLENMNVKLVNTDMVPVLPTVSYSLSGKSYDVVFDYVIDNFRILSGNYYLSVDVSDGNNTARAYTNILVTGIPKVLHGFFAATIPTPGTLNIYKCDTSWAASLFSSNPSDFTDLAVSDYWQQVYVNGSFSGPLKATSIDGSTSGFSIPSIIGSNPYWGPMSVSTNRLWVSYRRFNQFKSLDQFGNTNFTGNSIGGLMPGLILQNGNKIFTEQRNLSIAVNLKVFSTAGAAIHEAPMPMEPQAFYIHDANTIYVIANNGTQGAILIYDDQVVDFWSPILLPAATVTSSAQIDSNTLLIGMSNGSLYKFTYNPIGLVPWASGINATQMRYDGVNDEIYTADGTNVNVYKFNPFSLQRTILLPDSVRDLELWYNL